MIKTKLDTEVFAEGFVNQILNPFFDAWILMLALGGISSQLHIPRLAIGYWPSLLIIIASIVLFYQGYQTNARLKQIAKLLEDRQ